MMIGCIVSVVLSRSGFTGRWSLTTIFFGPDVFEAGARAFLPHQSGGNYPTHVYLYFIVYEEICQSSSVRICILVDASGCCERGALPGDSMERKNISS